MFHESCSEEGEEGGKGEKNIQRYESIAANNQ